MTLRGALSRILFGLLLVGCNEDAEEVELRSLQASTEMTFVCRDRNRQGLPRSQCPDQDHIPPENALLSLVTQTATDEVALIDVFYANVLDADVAVPGFSFLRMPSRPGDIVTTPGGSASFVGLTGVGKTGISALPTSCLGPPFGDQAGRDVTTFPACSLPSAPGDMLVLIEPPSSDGIRVGCEPSSALESESPPPPGSFEYRVVCDGVETLLPGDPTVLEPHLCRSYRCEGDVAPEECERIRDCSANLTAEGGPSGRRKLVVAIPDEGRVVVIDAQSLLDRAPGTFEACPIEASITLESAPDPAGQVQPDPEGLHPEGCMLSRPVAPPNPPSFDARPAGMAAADGRLYVADRGVPRVHVLDVSSVCAPRELPPLLPMAFDDPARDVTTSRVAVSPLTPSGKRFVYAIDPDDRPSASLMAFDVSPGVTDRTPVVRSGSIRMPGEQPDRIQYSSPIGDVTFALRDLPQEDPVTGVAPAGNYCQPDPDPMYSGSPGAQYRPANDYTQGARPELLRGLFGFAMLTSGEVMVIDVDDFDAPCRRPVTTNSSAVEDYRGCVNDVFTVTDGDANDDGVDDDDDLSNNDRELVEGERPTVTNEVSCNMVQPHRTRSAVLGAVTSTSGVSAPSLRALPQFTTPERSVQRTPFELPKLLAVDFVSPYGDGTVGVTPEVYIGGTLYRGPGGASGAPSALPLEMDPNHAEQGTLALPLVEPRNYNSSSTSDVTYEGTIAGAFLNGFLDFSGSSAEGIVTIRGNVVDTSASFCDQGVYDEGTMKAYASSVLGFAPDDPEVDDEDIDKFAKAHADYVQVTGDFPDAYDPYWVQYGDLACGGRRGCLSIFGSSTSEELEPNRDLRIIEAYQDHLVVQPRLLDNLIDGDFTEGGLAAALETAHSLTEALDCCFPAGTRYVVRASNQWAMTTNGQFFHDVVGRPGPDPDAEGPLGNYRCERDCDPRRSFNRSRVFEITSSVDCGGQEADEQCGVGRQVAPWMDPCAYDPGSGEATTGIKLSDAASACIQENLTSRFAVYRGLVSSKRDMRFRWETTGGFIPLSVNLRVRSGSVLPQRIEYVPEIQSLFVTDAAALGLSLAPLDTLEVDDPWPVF